MARTTTKPAARRAPWTLADYAAFADARGGKLLTKGPRTHIPKAHDKLRFRCKHGHEWTPRATGIKNQGYWCFRCARGGGDTWTIADYREHAIANGGHLVDARPASHRPLVTERLQVRCAAGHEWTTVAYSVPRDRPWCRICNRTADPWDVARYRAYAAERGGRLLSRHPTGALEHKTVVRFRCAAGHEWDTGAGQIKLSNTWCPTCANDLKRKPLVDLQALATERGGQLVNANRNRRMLFTWQCSRGHQFTARPGEVQSGTWCPQCSASRSERMVRAYFEQIFGKPFPRVRPDWLRNTTGRRLELDGYCEELAVAFEHQGGQHYRTVARFASHTLAEIKKRDARKRRLCRQRGIALIEIQELMRETTVSDLRQVIIRKCREAGVKVPRDAHSREVNVATVYANTGDDQALADLHRIAKSRGGECLADAYLGGRVPVRFRCSAGHDWTARPTYIRQGSWCRRCALEYTASRKRLTIEMMREIARERGGECLSNGYVNAMTKLRWRCGRCRREWEATPGSIRQGSWCRYCGTKKGWGQRA